MPWSPRTGDPTTGGGPAGVPDRLVLVAATAVRCAGVVMVGVALCLVWSQLPLPVPAAALAAALLAENAALIIHWRRTRTLGAGALVVDVLFGALVVLVGTALARDRPPIGWTDFAFPYTVLLSFTLGLSARRLGVALLAGGVWATAQFTGAILYEGLAPAAALFIVPSYLVNPVVGWASARLLRRGTEELDTAWSVATARAAELTVERERARQAWALHDRLLQTVETLAARGLVTDPELRRQVVRSAVWLRRFIESGDPDAGTDLAGRLAALAAEAGAEFNAAGVEARVPVGRAVADALVEALDVFLRALPTGRVVVRVAVEGDGLLTTVLAFGGADRGTPTGGGTGSDGALLDGGPRLGVGVENIRLTLSAVGGIVTVVPSDPGTLDLELRIPVSRTPATPMRPPSTGTNI